jgi:7-cyano-7-deazaguanine synthase
MHKEKHAFVLCSGGLDSTVTAHLVASQKKYDKITLLFFNYGQNSLKEERTASKVCAKNIHAFFREMALPELYSIARNTQLQAKKIKTSKSLKDTSEESHAWYFPCRNLIFLNYALALAESQYVSNKVITDIFVGFKSEGKEPFPDATQPFLDKLNAVSKECCAYPFVIQAPLINEDKEDIVLLGQKLNAEISKTFTCYSAKNGKHCGTCLACRIRKAGFYWANVKDPTEYIIT